MILSVGEDRPIDVIDVHSQETIVMSVKEFCEAFETPVEYRTSVLNCLSLEVTNLPLGDVVMPPLVARMLCWVTNVWPQSVQERWEGGEPPQVQKYCIMSMEGSYTGNNIYIIGPREDLAMLYTILYQYCDINFVRSLCLNGARKQNILLHRHIPKFNLSIILLRNFLIARTV